MADFLRILFTGDTVGHTGLKTVEEYLPELRREWQPHVTVVNGENIWEGKGPSESDAKRLYAVGANVITTGNHVWENWKSRPLLMSDNNVLRPFNYPKQNPGRGYVVLETPLGKVAIVQMQGRVYMPTINCPFSAMEHVLFSLREETNIVFVDFHGEATAEKIAFARYFDGKVSAIAGTHTHVQTADAQILPNGTGYITDVGMTGPYDSVIGMKTDVAIQRFILQTAHKYESAEEDNRIAGIVVDIDPETGKTIRINSFLYPEFKREA